MFTCLVVCMQVAGAAWRAVMRIVTVGNLVQKDGDSRTGRVVSCQTIERSDDPVCGLHRVRGDDEHEFLG
jgi:hypothetical protein